MYKTILIEDDIPVLKQLNNIILKTRNDFEIVGTFTHPQDAIDYIDENPVDAIITDIRLPSMTGIEVLKYCHHKYPKTKFAILSAYDNFEYAREAIDLEVVHYVLKPITISKLEIMLEKLSNKLEKTMHSEGFTSSSVTLQRQQVILNLLSGFYNDYSLFFSDMKKHNVLLNQNNCLVATISINFKNFYEVLKVKTSYSKDEIYNIIMNIVNKNNPSLYSVLFNFSDADFTIYVFGKSAESADEFKYTVSEYFSEISSDIFNILSLTSTMLSLETFENIDEFCKSQRKNSSFEEQSKNIISYIYDGNFDAAIRCIETLKIMFNHTQLKNIYSCILSQLFKITKNPYNTTDFSPEKLYNIIISEINNIKQNNIIAGDKSSIIETACKFINDNYANDITLNDVAKHVFLSPIYFSSYFKKKTGEKYSDYLQNIKLKKAIELLEDTDIKIPAIAEMSGFKDTNYFHKFFKNQTGFTPSEYRKKHRGEN